MQDILSRIDWDEVEERRIAGEYKYLDYVNGWTRSDTPIEYLAIELLWDMYYEDKENNPKPNTHSRNAGRCLTEYLNDDLMVRWMVDSSD